MGADAHFLSLVMQKQHEQQSAFVTGLTRSVLLIRRPIFHRRANEQVRDKVKNCFASAPWTRPSILLRLALSQILIMAHFAYQFFTSRQQRASFFILSAADVKEDLLAEKRSC